MIPTIAFAVSMYAYSFSQGTNPISSRKSVLLPSVCVFPSVSHWACLNGSPIYPVSNHVLDISAAKVAPPDEHTPSGEVR